MQRSDPIADRTKGTPTPPARTELLPTTYTDLSYFWRCPFEYQLRSLMGYGPGVKESYGYGQQIHNVLVELHRRAINGQSLSPGDVVSLVDQRFHLRYTRDGSEYKPLTQLREAAKKSLLRYVESYPDNSEFVLEAEKPFEFVDHDSGALISGTIDLLEKVERTSSGAERRVPVAVVDFKTHRWRDLESFLESKKSVESQLQLYALAVKKALGFDARTARAHFLSPKEPDADLRSQGVSDVVEVDVSPEQQVRIREKVSTAVSQITTSIASGSFGLAGCQSGHCPKCDFRTICPGFTRWLEADQVTPRPGTPDVRRAEEMRLVKEDVDAGAQTE